MPRPWWLVWVDEKESFSTMDTEDLECAICVQAVNEAEAGTAARAMAAGLDSFIGETTRVNFSDYKVLRVVRAKVQYA